MYETRALEPASVYYFSAMRVIAGTYRRRILKSLKGLALRPTSDRLRETLFNVLGAGLAGSRFVDLFAGTGAIGIEALSRGAMEIIFIENHVPAANLIRKNLESLGVRSGVTVLAVDALRGLDMLAARHRPGDLPFDFIFLDPPYAAADDYARVLRFLGAAAFLAADGIVIAEHHRKFDLPEHPGELQRVRVLKQGDAALSFFRRSVSRDSEIGAGE
jgi:16S rRNA (guanine966-N2)-methyltransferase